LYSFDAINIFDVLEADASRLFVLYIESPLVAMEDMKTLSLANLETILVTSAANNKRLTKDCPVFLAAKY
tara:strand:+ start:1866 stop:2075 length:210 start_codon:yes stop_codon:yes gene_type:complete